MPASVNMANKREKYGLSWSDEMDDLQIESFFIQKGGKWTKNNQTFGFGLFEHYRRAQKLMWPEDSENRWSNLILEEIIKNTITAILGPKDSGKTHCASKYALTDYFCFPNETLILISSTDLRGLEMRVWGDLKNLWERARNRFDWVPGHILESKHALCTDNLDDEGVRDMRKGIICIPCISSGGQFVGLSKYVGLKQKRRRLLADESQFMRDGFLDSVSNLNSGDFKGVFMGNPIGQDDPLDKVSEPKAGWDSISEPDKTTTWENRWIDGRTINLIGTDSPNFDYPQDQPPKFPYLINKRSIESVVAFYGQDSLQYHSQCKGTRRGGLNARRVMTREMCEQFHAFDDVVWAGTQRTKVAACDAAYGGVGGDRCPIGHIEFGLDVDGRNVIACHPPVMVPVSVARSAVKPEDQIAEFARDYCERHGIPPENFGFDSTGRGSLGTALARVWSAFVEPVEFGGSATKRPVDKNLFVIDEGGVKRLKLCYEHYRKWVTEGWFSVRYAVEANQMRQLPPEVAREFYMREWKEVAGGKIEIEIKAETKLRMGRSPDLADWLVTAVEVARRRGFQIERLASGLTNDDESSWLDEEADDFRATIRDKMLTHS